MKSRRALAPIEFLGQGSRSHSRAWSTNSSLGVPHYASVERITGERSLWFIEPVPNPTLVRSGPCLRLAEGPDIRRNNLIGPSIRNAGTKESRWPRIVMAVDSVRADQAEEVGTSSREYSSHEPAVPYWHPPHRDLSGPSPLCALSKYERVAGLIARESLTTERHSCDDWKVASCENVEGSFGLERWSQIRLTGRRRLRRGGGESHDESSGDGAGIGRGGGRWTVPQRARISSRSLHR